ncbi:MAG: M23 family metallopeptidase [Lachnospiraceae bacterium]|nr:M23 family metallopeptidase [Lachnospiraceae bacterium]
MVDEVTPKKHRHQRGYTVLIVSDDSDGKTGTLKVSPFAAQALSFLAFFAAVILICYIVYSVMTINGLQHVQLLQNDQILTLTKEKETLAMANSTLNARVEQLSKSINQKVVRETNAEKAETEKHLPTGFPLTGTATMTSTRDLLDAETIDDAIRQLNERIANGETIDSIPGDPILYFTDAAQGSSVVATGAGTVAEIEDDQKYGKRIVIDHGSGFRSIYRNAGDAMVRVGDEVTRGSILFLIDNNRVVGYQITQDGTYIDPETMADIDG